MHGKNQVWIRKYKPKQSNKTPTLVVIFQDLTTVLLCFVFSFALLCFSFVLLCFALFCFTLFCFVFFCFVLLWSVLFCFALLCFSLLFLFYLALLCYVSLSLVHTQTHTHTLKQWNYHAALKSSGNVDFICLHRRWGVLMKHFLGTSPKSPAPSKGEGLIFHANCNLVRLNIDWALHVSQTMPLQSGLLEAAQPAANSRTDWFKRWIKSGYVEGPHHD